MSGLVLSLFPGIGLLDMAFEEEGFCVVRDPEARRFSGEPLAAAFAVPAAARQAGRPDADGARDLQANLVKPCGRLRRNIRRDRKAEAIHALAIEVARAHAGVRLRQFPLCRHDVAVPRPDDAPIIEAIAPDKPFDQVTAALSAVGLGSVPAWLRPYRVLSTGERFRAELARLVCEAPSRAMVDEFTSVVDRQIARIGAFAFAKAWRRTGGQCVLLSCHYDILDWVQPDWVYDTAAGRFTGRWLRRRPPIELTIRKTDWSWWPYFGELYR